MDLKTWKESHGLSYADLAKELQISKPWAFKIASGHCFPRPEILERIEAATAGAVTAVDILRGLKRAAS